LTKTKPVVITLLPSRPIGEVLHKKRRETAGGKDSSKPIIPRILLGILGQEISLFITIKQWHIMAVCII
jgi:hypothetical protein